MRGRGIDEDAAGFHAGGENVDFVRAVDCVHVERRCVTVTAVGNQLLRLGDRIVKAFRFVHRQHGAEFFVSKFLADIYALDFTD